MDQSAQAECVLIEAESFADHGGWVLDQQFINEMGSPYLLAHGLGKPVQDAVTQAALPASGTWRLWVRTKNWAPTGSPDTAPGRFQILIDDAVVPVVFGADSPEWQWQDGGLVDIASCSPAIALHDLTGFEGRCDALLFSSDPDFVPPEDPAELARFRRSASGQPEAPEDLGEFDLVVVGGGIAGMCAALVAARQGLRTALVQNRPMLGGNNSSEINVRFGGEIQFDPFPHIGDIVHELRENLEGKSDAEVYRDAERIALLEHEPNLTLLLNRHAVAVEMDGSSIAAVVAQDIRSGKRERLAGKLFADCSGDADLGALAGADFDMQRTGHMGPSNIWRIRDTGKPASFPRCPWALDLADKPFPGRGEYSAQWATPGVGSMGMWFWECGFDWDPLTETERMRDHNFRAAYGAWDALKNVDHAYPNHELRYILHLAGKRESRRLMGDVVLTREDVITGKQFPDGCLPCTWGIDLHEPHHDYEAGFAGEEFISYSHGEHFPKPYWAPYRMLYSRNVGNLFMAGRNVSVTHEALGTVRVMRTTGMMGEIVGYAAAVCREQACLPAAVYAGHLDLFLNRMKTGLKRG